MAQQKKKTELYQNVGGINTKASPYVNDLVEARDLRNLNFSQPGAWTKRPGTELYSGATVSGKITGGIEYEKLNGASYIIAAANTNVYSVTPSGFTSIRSGITQNSIFDMTVFVDNLWACNGAEFFKYDGTTASAFSLPVPGFVGATGVIGGGLSGTFQAAIALVNSRGYVGPASDSVTVSLNGITFGSIGFYGISGPVDYAISRVQLFRSEVGGVDLFGATSVAFGATAIDTGYPLSTLQPNDNLFFTQAPKYLEIYNNQMFYAGFSAALSTVYWSEIGEPEGIAPEYFAEFRTNDGDQITGMKSYSGALIVTKSRSFHRVVGDNPSDFSFVEISDQYGCLSNRTMLVYNDVLWFLDAKGLVEFNGANVQIVSNKIEPIFQRMNVAAARETAVGIHYRTENQLWFAIPVDGSTINNLIIVYDYFAKAFTTYEGVNASHLMMAKGAKTALVPFYGGYTGTVANFGASLMGDLGQGITCTAKTIFLAQNGQSSESLYRRFYLNVDSVANGASQPITVNMYTDFGSSLQITRVMYQNPFQSRIDFGLPARAIQAEIVHASATLPLRITGFTFESRFLRPV